MNNVLRVITMALLSALSAALSAQPADQQITVQVGVQTRTCVVHLPRAYDGKRPLPLLIGLHGSGGTGKNMVGWFKSLADQRGFIVACPDGIIGKQHTWNSLFGRVPGGEGIAADNVDDIAFLRALIVSLHSSFHTDSSRVFICGHSSGAFMAYRAAVELADPIAAAAIVNGLLGIKLLDGKPSVPDIPKPVAPISLIHICGKKDGLVKFDGALTSRTLTKSVPDCLQVFVKSNACATPGKETRDAEHTVTRTLYSGGAAGTEVELVIAENCNHNWPNLKEHGLSATDEMWDFFFKHPKAPQQVKDQPKEHQK
ncbi:MAG: hypothetical protein NTX50_22715 [Candidatus Sumerlaeota bacterium]|nr:hypothetical protein [Candidatus Sumerlaeota bacterium]